jgi:acid stress-induced BolA-like protein IbaG/YrbA
MIYQTYIKLKRLTIVSMAILTTLSLMVLSVYAMVAAPTIEQIHNDTGENNFDGITQSNQISVTGSATSDLTVTVTISNSTPVSTYTVADGSGKWVADFTNQPLADGTYIITATETDGENNVSASSEPFTLTIDTVPPVMELFKVNPGTNAANPSVDFTLQFNEPVTSVLNSHFSVTNSVATTESVQHDSIDVMGQGKHYTVTVKGLIGVGSFVVRYDPIVSQAQPVEDIAGNQITQTLTSQVYTVTQPVIKQVLPDSGQSMSDGITQDKLISVSGLSTPNLTVTVSISNPTPVSTYTVADGSGNWVADFTNQPLADGTYIITATETDGENNVSIPSKPFTATIDSMPAVKESFKARLGTTASDSSVDFLLQFNEPVTSVLSSHFSVTTTNSIRHDSIDVMGEGKHYTVTLKGLVGVGDFAILYDPAVSITQSVKDVAGNQITKAFTSEAHAVSINYAIYIPLIEKPVPPSIINGGFENGLTGWTFGGVLGVSEVTQLDNNGLFGTSTQPAMDGARSLLLGSPDYENKGGVKKGYAEIKQTISVPSNDHPTLSSILTIDYEMYSHDLLWFSSVGYIDTFEVYVNKVEALRDDLCRNNGIWTDGDGLAYCVGIASNSAGSKNPPKQKLGEVTLDLKGYAGQEVELIIRVHNRNDKDFNTWAYVDDVKFEVR